MEKHNFIDKALSFFNDFISDEKDKPRRFKNNWCEPGFEILPHVSNSTCFALERRYGLESAATVRKYCPE